MKLRKCLPIIATMVLGLLAVGCDINVSNKPFDNDNTKTTSGKSKQENLRAVNVKDHGAKDFVEPIKCQLDGTNTIVAKSNLGSLSAGDYVIIINGAKPGRQGEHLAARVKAIDGANIILDRKCGSTILTKVYIDSTRAFSKAFSYANATNFDIIIPEGSYYVDGNITIETNVTCKGKLYTTNKGDSPLFIIARRGNPIKIKGNDIAGNLQAGVLHIPELEQYVLYDVILKSQELLMWRNNNPGEFYTKNETNRINIDGSLQTELLENYYDKSLLTLSLYKQEDPIKVEGLNIVCIDDAITGSGKSIVAIKRSDVTVKGLILKNENLRRTDGQRSGVNIAEAVNVVLDDCEISGFMLDGLGYGVTVINTLKATLNNTKISNTRHAVTGRHDNHTTINGGIYEGYLGTFDSHWGHNYTVNGCVMLGIRAIQYDGMNFTVNNCDITTEFPYLIYRRMDCPSIGGDVTVKNSKITYTGDSDFVFYLSRLTDFKHEAEEIANPNLIVEDVELILENDIPVVDIYTLSSNLGSDYEKQTLPDVIQIKNLYITGKENKGLRNTCFKMKASASMHYSGNPDILLDNIKINRDMEEDDSIGYDGEIVYYMDPEHAETEVPDTHYNMKIKDCGKLSVSIVPAILSDMLIENCTVIDYKQFGDLVDDWRKNSIWWYKGIGKTVFKNVSFDRTGLLPASLVIMNDAEFENCLFTNYGTVDYIDFGKELPMVRILKVKDCFINKDSITGGSLFSQFMSMVTDINSIPFWRCVGDSCL